MVGSALRPSGEVISTETQRARALIQGRPLLRTTAAMHNGMAIENNGTPKESVRGRRPPVENKDSTIR